MKIQILGIRDRCINIDGYDITYSNFSAPKTLDSFDINIIDLQDEEIWRYTNVAIDNINISADLKSIGYLLGESIKAYNIIALPQNYEFCYGISDDTSIFNKKLKDMLITVLKICKSELLFALDDKIKYSKNFSILYENSITNCSGNNFSSAFVIKINRFDKFDILTEAQCSKKPTTIIYKANCIISTLNIFIQNNGIKDFLLEIGFDKQKAEEPAWVKELNYFDDQQQNFLIQNNNNKIEELQQQNKQANEKLAQNSYYKSVLYESGDNLVKVVFDILGKMFDYDLSNFEDKKEEDVLIKFEDLTIVGEIKGIKGNVTSEIVSQTIRHKAIREDNNEKQGLIENVKGILIINTFRFKSLQEREKVQAKQINEAQKNNVLIILSQDLLKLFEEYTNDIISQETIINAFRDQSGLFDINRL